MLKPGGKIVLIAPTPVTSGSPQIVDFYLEQQKKKVLYPGFMKVNNTQHAKEMKTLFTDPCEPETLDEPLNLVKPGHYNNQSELDGLSTQELKRGTEFQQEGGQKVIIDYVDRGKKILFDLKDTNPSKWTIKYHCNYHCFTPGPLIEALTRAGLKVTDKYFLETNGQRIDTLKKSDFYKPYYKGLRVVVQAIKPLSGMSENK